MSLQNKLKDFYWQTTDVDKIERELMRNPDLDSAERHIEAGRRKAVVTRRNFFRIATTLGTIIGTGYGTKLFVDYAERREHEEMVNSTLSGYKQAMEGNLSGITSEGGFDYLFTPNWYSEDEFYKSFEELRYLFPSKYDTERISLERKLHALIQNETDTDFFKARFHDLGIFKEEFDFSALTTLSYLYHEKPDLSDGVWERFDRDKVLQFAKDIGDEETVNDNGLYNEFTNPNNLLLSMNEADRKTLLSHIDNYGLYGGNGETYSQLEQKAQGTRFYYDFQDAFERRNEVRQRLSIRFLLLNQLRIEKEFHNGNGNRHQRYLQHFVLNTQGDGAYIEWANLGMQSDSLKDEIKNFREFYRQILRRSDLLDRMKFEDFQIPIKNIDYHLFREAALFDHNRAFSTKKPHKGLDIPAREVGAPIFPLRGGTVKYAALDKKWGNPYIRIDLGNGYEMTVMHVQKDELFQKALDATKNGEKYWVDASQPVATVGQEGNCKPKNPDEPNLKYDYPQTHIEVRKDGKPLDPINMIKEFYNNRNRIRNNAQRKVWRKHYTANDLRFTPP